MVTRIFITGTGVISSIGNNEKEVFDCVKTGRSGIGISKSLQSVYRNEIPVGEVILNNKELSDLAGIDNKLPNSRTALLGVIAAKEAVVNAGISNINEFKTGLISSTSVGGMDRSEVFYKEFYKDKTKGRLKDIAAHDCGESTQKIASVLKLNGYYTTISTACSSAANAIMLGARLIRNGYADRIIAGGTDALSLFTINGFNSLLILDRSFCRPFDETRSGLNIGEGAGYVVLESEDCLKKTGKKAMAELTGYGNACDAFHQTASSPEGDGAYLAITKAFSSGVIKPEMIDYINVHGTGTPNNDLSEGMALQKVFNNKVPHFSSTKSATGHTLGASGGIEAVLSIMAIKNKIIFPSLNFKEQMKELTICPVKQIIENAQVNHVLSNSFGFGGNNTSLIFSAV
ncbi:MAG: beta-ketoacyl-[acyl-carrier-protein] synthase family protein [Bacteroidia bacterium]|nr:beta-ketoacyl-[acyl-carrier-protein] synthase family protein [Bacteroidia bacterium]